MKCSLRDTLLGVTSSIALLAPAASARAQLATTAAAHSRRPVLEEIVVTSQKRTQRLQDVPIAVTAITASTLKANRITTVADLSGVAPNVTVRPSAGSVGIPAFSIRGITSYGVVPGQDKEASVYLDGVYLGTPYASIFNLPDIQRIEVLRGPQGTLFGRNATTGAISVVTRDPTGKLGGEQDFTVGNYNQFRTRTSVELPSVGPFSGYFSYVHDQRRGDIFNLGAGQVWDRTSPDGRQGIAVSPRWLGSHDSNSYFVALKYQPTDSFKTIYKFDYSEDNYTPDGSAAIAINPAGLGPAGGGFLDEILEFQATPPVLDPSARRPDAVNNAFATPSYERVYGHNLTSTLQAADNLSFKNIFAYRDTFLYANTQLDGLGGLQFPAAFGGGPNTPFELLTDSAQATSKQLSDELQANYVSHFLTVTAGLIYFHQNTVQGGPPGEPNDYPLQEFPNGRIPLANQGTPAGFNPLTSAAFATSYNIESSLAAYTQAEVHVTSQIDLVGGVRVTDDKKSGTFVSGGTYVPGADGGFTDGTFINREFDRFHYQQTKPSYSFGVNYKPSRDSLLYAKYSDSFVSGGAVGGFAFKSETASSVEVGGKADFLDHRLRTNAALFDVEYRNLQSAQSGQNVGAPQLGTVVIDQGNANAKGFEIETTARPIDPVMLGASLGYTDVYNTATNPLLEESFGGQYLVTLIPKWTADLSAEYDTPTLFRNGHMEFRMDANWRSKQRTLPSASLASIPGFGVLTYIPANWIVNTRVSLVDVDVGGGHTAEIAGWARNLTNNRLPLFPDSFGAFALATTFQHARTYGLDVSLKF